MLTEVRLKRRWFGEANEQFVGGRTIRVVRSRHQV